MLYNCQFVFLIQVTVLIKFTIHMSNNINIESEAYLDQVTKLWTCFKSIESNEERQEFIEFLCKFTKVLQNSNKEEIKQKILQSGLLK